MEDGTEENGEPKIKCAALLDRIHPQDYISFSRYDMSPHGAGWSSSVARRAHNPKVVGSNPAPATKKIKPLEEILLKAFFFFLPYSYPDDFKAKKM